MNEQSGNSGQLQPDAESGGDARAQIADGALPPLPIAFFDEFGRGADDRVQDYARAAIAARQPVTMEDAIEAGDGTLHGAVDHWQERALRAEAELAARQPVGVEPFGWWVEDANGVGYFRRTIHPTYLAEYQYTPGYSATQLYTAPPAPEMSPDFTDTARAAIAWVLWHHQGGSSAIGQPLRYALGMGDHEELSAQQISEAKRYAESVGARTDDFKRPAPAAVQTDFVEVATCDEESADGFQWLPGFTRSSFPTGAGVFIGQPPAAAAVPMDAPYSLDADPAGIRSRVADCITGTMMVGAQNHTPPPAGHWLEPFWNMAQADAALSQPAAVPVDVALNAARWTHARKLFIPAEIAARQKDLHEADYVVSEAECRKSDAAIDTAIGPERLASMLATHPQPASASALAKDGE